MEKLKQGHADWVRRIGPGVYRAECDVDGWVGELHEGPWREARLAAQRDADAHAGREGRPAPAGPTPLRPSRIPDRLWLPLVAVAEAEGTSASQVLREAIEADPRIAARLEKASA